MNEPKNIQFGCGVSVAQRWANYDASPTLRLSKVPLLGFLAKQKTNFPKDVLYGDITRRMPVENGQANRVYCSHVLEHLALDDFYRALTEARRMLREGGVFRGVMPDLEWEAQNYLANTESSAAHEFMKSTHLGVKSRPKSVKQKVVSSFGNSAHLWLWDYKSLEQALCDAGFRNIRRARYGDSGDEVFNSVEDESRWTNALGWHCQK
ncbi:MAG: class I SAM-dependent methyltransferase [Pseudomonadota bacterium]